MPDPRALLDSGDRFERSGSLERALRCYESAAAETTDHRLLSEAFRRQAAVHRARCEWERALECARRGEEVARRAGLVDCLAEAVNSEASVYMFRGDLDAALPLLEQVLELARAPRLRAIALQNIGYVLAERGRLAEAEHRFQESYGCYCAAGDRIGEITALNNYSALLLDRHEYAEAARVLERAVNLARDAEDLQRLAMVMRNLAEALCGLKSYQRAEEYASEALGHYSAGDNPIGRVESIRLLGDIARERGDRDIAAECFQKALAIAYQVDARLEIRKLRDRLGAIGIPQHV